MKALERLAYILFVVCSFIPGGAQTAVKISASITEAELLRRTQELYDSLPSGDRKPWQEYYADDAMVYDEKGRSMDKKAFLADIEPMPSGYGGMIKVTHPHTIFARDTAVFAYECDETETIFGQELHARYHSVDTWLYRNDKWRIAASQTMRYYEDPAIGKTETSQLDDFAGSYELAPGNRRTVARVGNDLYIQRGGGAKTKLVPESGDLFFRPEVEGRIFFHRNGMGKVDAIYDRRNNEDVVWKKLD